MTMFPSQAVRILLGAPMEFPDIYNEGRDGWRYHVSGCNPNMRYGLSVMNSQALVPHESDWPGLLLNLGETGACMSKDKSFLSKD